jgi:hypothetical protein
MLKLVLKRSTEKQVSSQPIEEVKYQLSYYYK